MAANKLKSIWDHLGHWLDVAKPLIVMAIIALFGFYVNTQIKETRLEDRLDSLTDKVSELKAQQSKDLFDWKSQQSKDLSELKSQQAKDTSDLKAQLAIDLARLEKSLDRLSDRMVKTSYHGYKKGGIVRFEGEGNRTLIAKDEQKEWKCVLTADTQITIDSKDAKMDALRVGMMIEALVDDNDNALSIEAESKPRIIIRRREPKD